MAKLGISLPDDLCKKLDAAARDEGRTVSGVIQEALIAYFSKNGEAHSVPSSSNPSTQGAPIPPQVPQPIPVPSSADLQSLLNQIRELNAKISENSSLTIANTKTIGELDERLSKLWHQINDK